MMKKNIFLVVALLLSAITFSCNKEDFDYPEGKIGSSKITYYVNIAPKGEAFMIIDKGTPFTDEGATSEAGGKEVAYKTEGTVDPNTPGVYVITYSAVNEDGFPSSSYRSVTVKDPAVATNDFSGTYKRGATGQLSVWTKTGPGVYTVTNPGGAADAGGVKVTVVNYSGNLIAVPQQEEITIGTSSSLNGVFAPGGASYSWNFINAGYGTQSRTFDKQ